MNKTELENIIRDQNVLIEQRGYVKSIFREEDTFKEFLDTLTYEPGAFTKQELFEHEKAHFGKAQDLGYEVQFSVIYESNNRKLVQVSVDLDIDAYSESIPEIHPLHRIQIALAPKYHPIFSRVDYGLAQNAAGENLEDNN